MDQDRYLKGVREIFEQATQKFYAQTHGIIDLAEGQDSMSQTGVKDFLPDAALAIKEDIGEDILNKRYDIPTASKTLFFAFMSALNTDQKDYAVDHSTDYISAFQQGLLDFHADRFLTKELYPAMARMTPPCQNPFD